MEPFARQLRAERERLNLSQSECAALLPPLSVRTLQTWEHGSRVPPDWAQPLILSVLRRYKPRKSGSFNKPGQPAKD